MNRDQGQYKLSRMYDPISLFLVSGHTEFHQKRNCKGVNENSTSPRYFFYTQYESPLLFPEIYFFQRKNKS